MTYLTNNQISQMADAAVTSYEMSCSWERATEAAMEYAMDEFGVRPRRSAVLHSVNLAKIAWGEEVLRVRRAVSA